MTKFSIFGNLRMPAEWEKQKSTWIAWPHNKKDWPNKLMINPSYINKKKIIIYKSERPIPVINEEPLKKEVEAFLKCTEKSYKPITNIDEGVNVQIVLDMIDKKLKEKYG